MKLINKKEFYDKKDIFLEEMKKGKIFVYPTDTIYGIGCDASNNDSVKKIRKIKKRDDKPFSVIAPNKKWILENCFVSEKVEKWLDKLPGNYTLILELKNWEAVSSSVNAGLDNLGIRIPKHWFSEIVSELGVPFVTTSVNLAREKNMTSIDDIDKDVKNKVDYIIYEGLKQGKPSTIVNLINNKEDILER